MQVYPDVQPMFACRDSRLVPCMLHPLNAACRNVCSACLTFTCLPADTSSGSFAAWTSKQAADGQTPHDYAAMDGSHALNTFIEQKQAGELPEEEGDFAFDPETGELLDDCIGADGEAPTVRSSSGSYSMIVPGRQQHEAASGHDAPPRAPSSGAGSREGECLAVVTCS